MAETVRKKIKWPTKRRKGGSRVWKSKWVTLPVNPADAGGGASKKEARKEPKKEGGAAKG